ncbi:dnaJ homolog subfamily C member 22 [Pristis pectinata]|uniref:dnaJ homolog subfamily C member 22 n=1 Tax=Pristis pectinata TaxID=685728 RepID=UPI00223D3457|nr:dnaJ homolog subfamily C member 22 [Pristis pectinata]
MVKSLMITYVLWSLGGPLGLHHIYLGRDSHALLWMVTFGGFGFGWIREFWQLPKYVQNANFRHKKIQRKRDQQPSVKIIRTFGQFVVGVYFGIIALISLSPLSGFYIMVLPLAITLGVHLVANVGEETSNIKATMMASFVTSIIFYGRPIATIPISIVASVVSMQHRLYKTPSDTGDNLSVRLYRLGLAWLAFTMPISYCMFHNTTVTITYITDTISFILDSVRIFPLISGLFESILLLPYHTWKLSTGGTGLSHGYNQEWEKLFASISAIQTERERLAYKVLGLQQEATLEEINKSYRELVKRWHPDHNRHNLNEAEQQFLEIQAAYEVLTKKQTSDTQEL